MNENRLFEAGGGNMAPEQEDGISPEEEETEEGPRTVQDILHDIENDEREDEIHEEKVRQIIRDRDHPYRIH